jgi:hypothetical protein
LTHIDDHAGRPQHVDEPPFLDVERAVKLLPGRRRLRDRLGAMGGVELEDGASRRRVRVEPWRNRRSLCKAST